MQVLGPHTRNVDNMLVSRGTLKFHSLLQIGHLGYVPSSEWEGGNLSSQCFGWRGLECGGHVHYINWTRMLNESGECVA